MTCKNDYVCDLLHRTGHHKGGLAAQRTEQLR